MRKIIDLFLLMAICVLCASAFGIIHDQITFSISREYFTLFKFKQFRIAPTIPARLAVTAVGFLATWWTGIFIGFFLSMASLKIKDRKHQNSAINKAVSFTFITTISGSFIGYFVGKFMLQHNNLDWSFPLGLADKHNFIIVGSIHNFSYLAAFIGLVIGIFYLLVVATKQKNNRLQ